MGTPQKNSFANAVRTAIKARIKSGHASCTTGDLAEALVMDTKVSRKRILTALRDMAKAGELTRVSPGVYTLAKQPPKPPELRQVMWSLLRMRRAVSVEDLMELSGAVRDYAAEWLRALVRRGVVRQDGDTFRLIKDTVAMPELTDNADRLRAMRDKKKQAALSALVTAADAIAKAHDALNEL